MERLTKRGAISQRGIDNLMDYSDENQFGRNDAYYKLQHYEDLEENGKLVILPCKIGEVLYRIEYKGYLKDTCETDCYSCNIPCPYEGREYERIFEIVPWKMRSVGAIVHAMEKLGDTVFFSQEEAEAALNNI